MNRYWAGLVLLALAISASLVTASAANAHRVTGKCPVANDEAAQSVSNGDGLPEGKKNLIAVAPKPDSQSAAKSVNFGTDREAERLKLSVNLGKKLKTGYERNFNLVAEPITSTSETGESIVLDEPSFSYFRMSGNREKVTFWMCVDPQNDLPAGKYVGTVLLEGPVKTETAVMTITYHAKDGNGFILALFLTLGIAMFVLLYKGAAERRDTAIAKAEAGQKAQKKQLEEAKSWGRQFRDCIHDWGWWIPTVASVGAVFAVLWAAYDSNPAWGEGGTVTSALALIGAGLAAVGAGTILTRNSAEK